MKTQVDDERPSDYQRGRRQRHEFTGKRQCSRGSAAAGGAIRTHGNGTDGNGWHPSWMAPDVTLALRPDRYRARSGALPQNAHKNNNAKATPDIHRQLTRSARKGNNLKTLHNNVQILGSRPTVPSPNPAHNPVCLALPHSLPNPVWSPLS